MSAAPNFVEDAVQEVREEFDAYMHLFGDVGGDWPEPASPSWPRYSPEGEAYVNEFNRLASEAGIAVRID